MFDLGLNVGYFHQGLSDEGRTHVLKWGKYRKLGIVAGSWAVRVRIFKGIDEIVQWVKLTGHVLTELRGNRSK